MKLREPALRISPRSSVVVAGRSSLRAESTPENHEGILRRQLQSVLKRSPFYARKIGPCEIDGPRAPADLSRLPFTTRAELESDQESSPPFGSYLAADRNAIARVHKTSGSTGRSLWIALARSDVEAALEVGARCFRTAGVMPGQLIVHCLNYCLWSGGLTDHEALERSGAGVIPFGVGNTTELLRVIQAHHPAGIHCTPSYLMKLEERLRQEFELSPDALGLKLGLFGGEQGLQDPAFRERIERIWGLRAIDANYGMSEVLSMFGAECPARCGLHFLGADQLFPEILDPATESSGPLVAGARGELVLTHLRRICQPLIRYRTSDVIEVLANDCCACGREGPRFRVIGRVDDMIVVRGVNVFCGAVAASLRGALGRQMGEYRLAVSREPPIREFVVEVEVENPTTVPTANIIEDALQRDLGVRPTIRFLPLQSLTRSDSKTTRIHRILP